MQELKRLDDLLERDAKKLESKRRPERQSDMEKQIDATTNDIRRAFGRSAQPVPVPVKLAKKA